MGRLLHCSFFDQPKACNVQMFFADLAVFFFCQRHNDIADKIKTMKNYMKILFSILAAAICTVGFAADKPNCKKTGKNCPMNDNKECNCGKSCNCANM